MTEKILLQRIEKFYKRVSALVISEWIPFNAEFSNSKDQTPFSDRLKGEFKSIKEGDLWGEPWDSAWFHLQATAPKQWGDQQIVAYLDFSGEGLVLDTAGVPIQGVSSGSIFAKEFNRDMVRLNARGGDDVELWVEASGNDLFGIVLDKDPAVNDPNRFGSFECTIRKMRLGLFDEELWHFLLDFDVLHGIALTSPENSVRRARAVRCLNEAINAFKDDRQNTHDARNVLQRELNKPASASDLSACAIGHAHIDTAWLWPVSESVRKCARTFSSQVKLLYEYPEYVFGASQPQHYLFIKQTYPELYEKIKSLVAQGRWELQGGMWVEADCNLISGESMVRQFLHGKNFFMDEFGVEVKNLWLPDVFGYSASMPQILRKCGVDFFLTQKLSWNQTNEIPHHTFKWRGIDGTDVITHFPPENNYNSMLNPQVLVPGRDRFKEKAFLDEFLSLYGIGDGGGGPKEENIECGRRMANVEGAPRVRFGHAQDFFNELEKHSDQLATWVGELYLELHRGTLTSQGKVKKGNRLLENTLREVEMLWSCLDLEQYPSDRLDAVWKKLLINQFHDILPGSSINKAYQVTHKEHEEALSACRDLANDAAELLFEQDEDSLVIVNTLSYPFAGVVELPAEWTGASYAESGEQVPLQKENDVVVGFLELEPFSFTTLKKNDSSGPTKSGADNSLVLENELVRYVFDATGQLIDAFDKEQQRAILAQDGRGNVLSLYDDRPLEWDAWDVDLYYEDALIETLAAESAERMCDGEVRQGLRFRYTFSNSVVEQEIYLAQKSKRLDFKTRATWDEKHRMLRVSFAVNVYSEQAGFDIPYGYVKRNTHRNTSWDEAKFEVVGQRYADLSDNDYGVALLNDCKYGYKVLDNMLDLNLLRSPTYPDPAADEGEHEFVYSLAPHAGDLARSDVFEHAAVLNQPPILFSGKKGRDAKPPVSLQSDGLSLEVVKKAEKEDALIIRVVERRGRHSQGVLKFPQPPQKIVETNLIEWEEGRALEPAGSISITLKPFEIATYKITLS